MTTQSEQTLENDLLSQLEGMEYARVDVPMSRLCLQTYESRLKNIITSRSATRRLKKS